MFIFAIPFALRTFAQFYVSTLAGTLDMMDERDHFISNTFAIHEETHNREGVEALCLYRSATGVMGDLKTSLGFLKAVRLVVAGWLASFIFLRYIYPKMMRVSINVHAT
jgi:hypothetical protein